MKVQFSNSTMYKILLHHQVKRGSVEGDAVMSSDLVGQRGSIHRVRPPIPRTSLGVCARRVACIFEQGLSQQNSSLGNAVGEGDEIPAASNLASPIRFASLFTGRKLDRGGLARSRGDVQDLRG